MRSFVEDLGSHALSCIETTETSTIYWLMNGLSHSIVDLVKGISKVVTEQDSKNDPAEEFLPPVLPLDLVQIRGKDFTHIIRHQQDRLLLCWPLHDIQLVEEEFQQMKTFLEQNDDLKKDIENYKNKKPTASFDELWDLIGPRFQLLRSFCGGLATAFPGTSTVESDFSIVKWEKDVFRSALTDLSLEGILHTKQFSELNSLGLY